MSLPRDPRVFLWEAREAARNVFAFLSGKSFADYLASVLLRSAVERQFEIIGEALAQLARSDAGLAARLPETARVVAFSNRLIHGYRDVDHQLVWSVAQSDLPPLAGRIDELLKELGEPG